MSINMKLRWSPKRVERAGEKVDAFDFLNERKNNELVGTAVKTEDGDFELFDANGNTLGREPGPSSCAITLFEHATSEPATVVSEPLDEPGQLDEPEVVDDDE